MVCTGEQATILSLAGAMRTKQAKLARSYRTLILCDIHWVSATWHWVTLPMTSTEDTGKGECDRVILGKWYDNVHWRT